MHSEITIAISGAIGTVARILVGNGLSPRFVSVIVAVVSLAAVLLYGFDAGNLARETSWDYALVWIEVNGLTYAAYHGANAAMKKFGERNNGGR